MLTRLFITYFKYKCTFKNVQIVDYEIDKQQVAQDFHYICELQFSMFYIEIIRQIKYKNCLEINSP